MIPHDALRVYAIANADRLHPLRRRYRWRCPLWLRFALEAAVVCAALLLALAVLWATWVIAVQL